MNYIIVQKYKEGWLIRKKVKFNNKLYNIKVYTYSNGRIRLRYENKSEGHEITINLEDSYIDDGKVFLDPFILKNGFIHVLKKYRIIKDITGMGFYNYIEVPIAKLNMGKLREFDNYGVKKHLSERMDMYK